MVMNRVCQLTEIREMTSTSLSPRYVSLELDPLLHSVHLQNSPAMELFCRRRSRLYRPKWRAIVFLTNRKKYMKHMHGNIPWCMFDCWADPVVHMLLLKSSMLQLTAINPNESMVGTHLGKRQVYRQELCHKWQSICF